MAGPPGCEDHFELRPWYVNNLEGRTGTLLTHAMAGVTIGGFGVWLLLLALYRARQLAPGQSFTQTHVPDRDPVFLRRTGIAVVCGCLVVIVYFNIDTFCTDVMLLAHCTLAGSQGIAGIAAIYESYGKLPFDTHRRALALALFGIAIIWYTHAQMKPLPVDKLIHELLALEIAANAVVLLYSVRNPDSVYAFLAGWAGLVIQGLWLVIAGFYESWIDLSLHNVSTYFVLLILGVFLTMVVVFAHFGPKLEDQDTANPRGNFRLLSDNADEDEEAALVDSSKHND